MSAKMNMALSENTVMKKKQKINYKNDGRAQDAQNASYFALPPLPKQNPEMLHPVPGGQDVQHKPFHTYTMKQAIQEALS